MVRLYRSILVMALVGGSSWASAQQQFMRGDANGDGLVTVADVLFSLDYLVFGTAAPITACPPDFGAEVLDGADFNDNEFFTIADPVRLGVSLFGNPLTLFPPVTCGTDPTSGVGTFGSVDPAYRIFLGAPRPVTGSPGRVGYPIWVQTPTPLVGLEVYFANPVVPALSQPTFVGPNELGASTDTVLFSVIVLRLLDAFDPLTGIGPGVHFLGMLEFELTPDFEAPLLQWVPEYVSGFQRRATLIDASYQDHWPAFTAVTSPIFFRGDVSADGVTNQPDGMVTAADLSYLTTYLWSDAATPVSQCGPLPTLDALDINDNEHVTIGDVLYLTAVTAGLVPSSIPAPSTTCGPDPSEVAQGFEHRDPAYQVIATDLTIVVNSPADIRALVDFSVTSPGPVRGLQLSLLLPAGCTPFTPVFVVDPSLSGLIEVRSRAAGNLLTVAVMRNDGVLLAGGAQQVLGVLQLDLAEAQLVAPIEMLAEATLGARLYRSTVVDGTFSDHHPVLGAGAVTFIRGDANNQVGIISPIDVADPIFIINYLFVQGPPPPCLDAADTNDDGVVNIADIINVLGYLFSGLSPGLPAPFQSCGLDPDIDLLDCQGLRVCP